MNNEDEVQRVFRGELDTAKWAIPRLVKVFIASTRNGKCRFTSVVLSHLQPAGKGTSSVELVPRKK